MSNALKVLRTDVAEVVADVLGIPCSSVYNGNPEGYVAQVRWGSAEGDWLDFKAGTFCAPAISMMVIITCSGIDYEGAQEYLEPKAIELLGIKGQPLTNGGFCPGVASIGEPGHIDEDDELMGIAAALHPIQRNITPTT